MKKMSIYFCYVILIIFTKSYSQSSVDVNMNVKHIVGGKSEFDRNKYITLHSQLEERDWPNPTMQEDFLLNYDVYLGRNNGILPWNASTIKEDTNKPGWPDINDIKSKSAIIRNTYANNTSVHKFENRNDLMLGGQKGNYPTGENISTCCGITPWKYASNEASAEFYAHFIKEAYGNGGTNGEPRPTYLEVINEPFVHANDMNTTNAQISEFHSAVAKRVKELNPNILVGGFTAAHPQHVSNNFDHWNQNWKTFIDIAGEDMDFFSFHLYDVQKRGTGIRAYRAGSNTEAIFDMIESYSKLKLGKIVPFNISEFGYFAPDLDGTDYTKERDWYNLRSFSTIMMQLMEKPDVIIKSMPFMLLKATWWKPPSDQPADAKYPYRLFRQKKELEGETGEEWVYTEFIKFFQLWSDVKGTRVDTKAVDIDIQTDAYINGNKMYLILNNLEHDPQTIDLNLIHTQNNPVQSVKIKHLYENNKLPIFDEYTNTKAPNQVRIGREATMILEYTFQNTVLINESSTESKIYADRYLQSINAGQANQFNFKTSELTKSAHGELVLRLGIGRDHPAANGAFVFPKVYFNDIELSVPSDWRGYDQRTRDRFFGVLEIPVPYDLIDPNLPTDHTVKVVFSNGGGHVSSAVLQKFDFTKQIRKNTFKVSMQNLGSTNFISSADEDFMICNRTTVGDLEKFEIIGQVGNGNVISIKGSNGKYVSSENGLTTMTCNRNTIGGWEQFTLEGSNGVYALKGNNGLYVRNNMLCTADEATDWQKFKITTNSVSFQNQGSTNYISSADENFMICNRTVVQALEKFDIIGQVANGNVISIRGNNGKYVSSENGTKTMTCNRNSIGDWEKFTLIGSNGIYALQGSNGLYVRNDMNCTSVEATDWQKFKITTEPMSQILNKTFNSKPNMVVYENKNDSSYYIKSPEISDGMYDAMIYNMHGKLVKSLNIRFIEQLAALNIDELSKGLYLLKLNNIEFTKTIKFIKN